MVQVDGSLVVWDLREPSCLHQKYVHSAAEWILRRHAYNTGKQLPEPTNVTTTRTVCRQNEHLPFVSSTDVCARPGAQAFLKNLLVVVTHHKNITYKLCKCMPVCTRMYKTLLNYQYLHVHALLMNYRSIGLLLKVN